MDYKIKLSEHELQALQTSLIMTLTSFQKYIEVNGKSKLDQETLGGVEEMKKLFQKFEKIQDEGIRNRG